MTLSYRSKYLEKVSFNITSSAIGRINFLLRLRWNSTFRWINSSCRNPFHFLHPSFFPFSATSANNYSPGNISTELEILERNQINPQGRSLVISQQKVQLFTILYAILSYFHSFMFTKIFENLERINYI